MTGPRPTDNDLMTVEEAAQFLRVPISWIYGRTRNEGLPMVRIGKHIRFSRRRLKDWVARQEMNTGGGRLG